MTEQGTTGIEQAGDGEQGTEQGASQGRGFAMTPAEVREMWVAALRSGRYRRGTNHLRKTENGRVKYCCLGVLCDVLIKAGMEIEVVRGRYDGVVAYDGSTGTLPDSVQEAAGLMDDAGGLVKTVTVDDHGDETVYNYLTNLNDDAEWSFRKIADLIEQGGVETTDDGRERETGK